MDDDDGFRRTLSPCTPRRIVRSGLMKHQSKQKQVKKALAATKKNPGMVAAAKEKQCALQCPTCRVSRATPRGRTTDPPRNSRDPVSPLTPDPGILHGQEPRMHVSLPPTLPPGRGHHIYVAHFHTAGLFWVDTNTCLDRTWIALALS